MADDPVIKLPTLSFNQGIRSASGLELSPTTLKAIDDALQQVPDGHGAAVLDVGLTGVQALLAVRKPGPGSSQWTVGAYVGKPWAGPVDAGVRLKLSF